MCSSLATHIQLQLFGGPPPGRSVSCGIRSGPDADSASTSLSTRCKKPVKGHLQKSRNYNCRRCDRRSLLQPASPAVLRQQVRAAPVWWRAQRWLASRAVSMTSLPLLTDLFSLLSVAGRRRERDGHGRPEPGRPGRPGTLTILSVCLQTPNSRCVWLPLNQGNHIACSATSGCPQ